MQVKKIIIVVIRQKNNTSFFFEFSSAAIFSYRCHKHYLEKFFPIFRESLYVSAAAFPSYVRQTLRFARLTKLRFYKVDEIDTGPTVRSLGIRPTSLVHVQRASNVDEAFITAIQRLVDETRHRWHFLGCQCPPEHLVQISRLIRLIGLLDVSLTIVRP